MNSVRVSQPGPALLQPLLERRRRTALILLAVGIVGSAVLLVASR